VLRAAYCVQVLGVPTFYLLTDVQGIVSVEHAERIARDVLGVSADDLPSISVELVKL
jgi:uncharacterized protein (UPF0212 family)